MLQLLSRTKCLFIQFQSTMTIFHYRDVRMQNIPDYASVKVSKDDGSCKLIHKKGH